MSKAAENITGPDLALLASDAPRAGEIVNAGGTAPFLLICDHASALVPRALDGLGLDEAVRTRHIGWDIGAAELARRLSARFDAPLVLAGYSRLVIDCNRRIHSSGAIVAISEETEIPGNRGLSSAEIAARIGEIHRPYQDCVAAVLDSRDAPILIDLHSFTPVFKGLSRPWPVSPPF